MYLIAIGWMYVVLMVALAEATSSQGSVLGGFITFVVYGLLPMGLLLYIFGTPFRRKALRAKEAQALAAGPAGEAPAMRAAASDTPDGGGVAAGDGVAAERKES